jgi:hypothetical protein
MSLVAVVFKNRHQIEPELLARITGVDSQTGQVLFDLAGPHVPLDHTLAIRRDLGNVAQIGAWHGEVRAVLGQGNSVVLDRVLYSGSHCGDVIALADMTTLGREIDELERAQKPEMSILLSSLRDIVTISREVGNPIVFL